MSAIEVNDRYPFEFETVKVDEQGNIIERKQGRAFAFRESLTDEIGLENVVMRGGSFNDFPAHCRSASRQLESPERYSRYRTNGFRVVCEIPKNP
jgi:formylglycine-generating enzyme required for sulfatase activity